VRDGKSCSIIKCALFSLLTLLQTSRAGNGPSASLQNVLKRTFTSDVTDTDRHRQTLADSVVRIVDVSAPVHAGLRTSWLCCHFSSQHSSGKMNDAKLILLVQNHELLYNTNHKCYSDNAAKEEIWSAIGDELGQTGTWHICCSFIVLLQYTVVDTPNIGDQCKWSEHPSGSCLPLRCVV
jgi:hypothetical protein